MILVIGQLRLSGGEGPATLRQQGYRFACLAELDAPLLQATRPDMVVSALIGDRFDAVDVARRLVELGYEGPYRALSTPLPKPALVRSEVRSAAPGLDFDLVIVSHDPDQPG
jgi:hypothetical protein